MLKYLLLLIVYLTGAVLLFEGSVVYHCILSGE